MSRGLTGRDKGCPESWKGVQRVEWGACGTVQYECPMGWKSVQKERGMLRGEEVCLQGVRDELSIG